MGKIKIVFVNVMLMLSKGEKLAILNKLEIVDTDRDTDGTVIYINVCNNEKNVNILRQLGATEEDFQVMYGDQVEDVEELDISTFAFAKLGADLWNNTSGFHKFTNGERIRNMDDEELANFIYEAIENTEWDEDGGNNNYEENWLEWLKEESTN